MSKVFQRVGSANPGRSVFNLSYEKKLTCDMGQLIPVMADEVIPGDIFTLGSQVVARMQPMVAPCMHEINLYSHSFFVPYRLLWDDWEDFITGGVDGDIVLEPPVWEPPVGGYDVGSLWDYFGLPISVVPDGAFPLDFIRRAYNFIWNEYYRDETLQDEVDLSNDVILHRCWEKDYFTSSLPWQQRGIAPALPISGLSSAVFDIADVNASGQTSYPITVKDSVADQMFYVGTSAQRANLVGALNKNVVDLSSATTFNVADLRLAFQIQKWLERNARAGARYTEFLKSHFGAYPRDERLQRPEYIGGSKIPLIISEVLQTSSTDATSPQGNLAGHGITANSKFMGKYRVQEFGVIITLMSIMPRTAYQQGIDRQWLRRTKYDFYFPEFANLSEQAVENAEICATDSSVHNLSIFGYQGRYDEMRVKRNLVCGEMRGNLDYWHLGRIFDLGSPPALNADFIKCVPSKRIFAVPSEPGFIVNYGNLLRAIRPMPVMSNPGMIDH